MLKSALSVTAARAVAERGNWRHRADFQWCMP
jgi:hypothetical protein